MLRRLATLLVFALMGVVLTTAMSPGSVEARAIAESGGRWSAAKARAEAGADRAFVCFIDVYIGDTWFVETIAVETKTALDCFMMGGSLGGQPDPFGWEFNWAPLF